MAALEAARNIIRDGVHRVYAVRRVPNVTPVAVFSDDRGLFGVMVPRQARYNGAHRNARFALELDREINC